MKLASRPLVAGTVGLSLAATLAVAATGGAPADAQYAPAEVPAAPAVPEQILTEPATVRTIALRAPAARSAAAADAGDGTAAAVPAGPTAPFSMVGLTWTDPRAALGGTAQVRVRAVGGGWSAWQTLETDGEAMADGTAGTRGSSDPLWVGDSDGVQARVLAAGGTAADLPAGLRLDLVDPGTTVPAPATGRSAASAPADAGTAAAAPGRPVPPVVRRSQWGANEKLMPHGPEYTGWVQALFVHHTAGTNDYACADSPRLLRGIQAYHVKSRGWNDIGYNFLVDRCGTLYEGRAGGIGRPVLGAHTFGFNSDTAGIAVMGNYERRYVNTAVKVAVARIAAWKIGEHGYDPLGKVVLTARSAGKFPAGTRVTMNRIAGHRNAVGTACPGDALYSQLPSIRVLAAAAPTGLALTGLAGSVRSGNAWYTRGAVTARWTVGTPTALLSSFVLYVDGRIVGYAGPGARSAALTLAPGRHVVQVRAVHLAGRTATTPALTVVADRTGPAVSPPGLALRAGTVGHAAVPVTLGYGAADPAGVGAARLTSPFTATLAPAGRRYATTAVPGTARTWTVAAADRVGNVRSAATNRTVGLYAQSVAAHTAGWRQWNNGVYLNGSAWVSTTAGARLSWTFTGRAVGLVASRGNAGQVRVSVDGGSPVTVDTRAARITHRQLVWARWFPAAGTHTVTVTVVGTPGRPAVTVDGFATIR